MRANPVAAALDDTIVQFRLPRQALVDLIDARIFDLYDDPMPSLNDLEGYCGETSSSLIRLSSLVLADGRDPGAADAAGHAGVAYAITGLLRAFPWHARRGQVYLPARYSDRHGVVRDDIVTGRGGPGLSGRAGGSARRRPQASRAGARRCARRSRCRKPPSAVALVEPYLRPWSGATTIRSTRWWICRNGAHLALWRGPSRSRTFSVIPDDAARSGIATSACIWRRAVGAVLPLTLQIGVAASS